MTTALKWDQETLERFWAYHAQTPENYFSYSKSADVVRRARPFIGPSKRVLDYGCGPGFLLPHLLKAGCDVWGGDISVDVIGEPARSIPEQDRFHGVHTIDSLIGHQQFDAITLLEVVEHLDDDALTQVMSNIDKLLAPGGVLIVTTPNDERLEDSVVYCPVSDVTFHRWQHMRSWSRQSLTSFLGKRGFKIEKAAEVNFRDQNDKSSPLNKIARQLLESLRKKNGLLVVARR